MNCWGNLGRVFLSPANMDSRLALPRGFMLPLSHRAQPPGLGGSSSTLSWTLFLTAAALCDPTWDELFHSHPAWEALGCRALQLHSLFQGTLSWSLESQFYFSVCMKFFPVRSKSVIVSACAGIIPGLFLLSILDLAFISQHCHNWCTWLEAEKSVVCFPSPRCLKGLGTECPPPAETHSTHQHHFMGLYLPLSVHKSACQVLLLGWGWNSPRGWPSFPEAELSQGTAVSVGSKLGIHSPHRSHPCLAAPTNTGNSWGH